MAQTQTDFQVGPTFAPMPCALCKGSGQTGYAGNEYSSGTLRTCESCGGAGTALVAQPPSACALCKGSGQTGYAGNEYASSTLKICESCGGCGHSHRIGGRAARSTIGGFETLRENPDANNLPVTPIATTSQASAPVKGNGVATEAATFGSAIYFTGVFISMGMNFALGKGFGALILCWLSWVNVGFEWVALIKPVTE